ncbi:MAG: formate transporter FocA [Anaerolineales bacterium]|nr:formate transporter FocA [Anaerolineales bacterium]
MTNEIRIDALLPAEMAVRAEHIGVSKAEAPTLTTVTLAILAGIFISLGAVFATIVATETSAAWPYGVAKLLTGFVFCLGLILVVVGGAELFTGNNMIIIAWSSRKVTTRKLLRNWVIVYIGNLLGSIGIAVLVFLTKQYTSAGGAVGATALSIANGKVGLDFFQAITLGIMCNMLVCLAIWVSFSARSSIDRIATIIFPITAFVAAGFEHSVANMYFIPIGLLIKVFDPAFASATGMDLSGLTWGAFLVQNLLPVTIGNIIGGSVGVAAVYWSVFLRPGKASNPEGGV